MSEWYRKDLAYIHDVGFRSYVLRAMPGILAILRQHGIQDGLIVDLGCGSGLSAEELVRTGYQVLGVDISADMIEIARCRVPMAEFQLGSLFKVEIPDCNAVISISECFNYLFDPDHQTLTQVFQRIYDALTPGGVFIFDIAEPGQLTSATPLKSFTEGEDWIVLVEKQEDSQHILTRRIITFRQVGNDYRRDDEVHRQQLYAAAEIATMLQQVGYQVEIQRCYGQFALPNAHAALIARKPMSNL
ncbi:class I SAM-dependent methyltransferase [Coleofasciculus sp. FACHB-T130]|uniref:class I SAM-dependent methyltransferase n=1 Tax=Cyanophyceae TaxID=3028117 RepID=UPI001684C907|nr:class I SAM-dependent methyltransferase [Coleofasciculus sp. FACHB-T130]MBD1880667.1 methyltransferase domain-containing protein [Coleofasciculus sp. FACHB-T130]